MPRINFKLLLCLILIPFFPQYGIADIWDDYRQVLPYHVQEIAVSRGGDPSTLTVIVSEPSDAFPQDDADVAALFERAFGQGSVADVTTRKHYILLDGWTRDVVVELRRPEAEFTQSQIDLAVAWLSELTFGSSRYAYYRDLDAMQPVSYTDAPENIEVSLHELEAWLLGETALQFTDREQGARPLDELISSGESGLYTSTEGAVVAWVFDARAAARGFGALRAAPGDTGTDAEMRRAFRQLTLSGDLILGALRDRATGRVAILARARQVSLDALPPLRFEELRRLAAAASTTSELGQSYERGHAFAGKVSHGAFMGFDVAPIYLSDQLQDSEIGSLLNIADQLLKSWSQAGDVAYFNFPYPKPDAFPFERPLSKVIAAAEGTSETLFNWNTVGAAAEVQSGRFDIAAPLRTGALPVTYQADLDGDELSSNPFIDSLEDIAWTYFAERRDPHLTRVVQYAFLFQVFRTWGITAEDQTDPGALRVRLFEDKLEGHIAAAIDRAETGGLPEFHGAKIADLNLVERLALQQDVHSARTCLVEQLAALDAVDARIRDNLVEALSSPERLKIDQTDMWLGPFRLAEFTGFDVPVERKIENAAQSENVRKYLALDASEDISECLYRFLDGTRFINSVVKAADVDPADGSSIRTPTLVLSGNLGADGWKSVGGHNLSADLPRLVPDASVPRGRPEVDVTRDGRMEIRIHPSDQPGARDLGRIAQRYRNEDPAQLRDRLSAALKPRDARPVDNAIGFRKPFDAAQDTSSAIRSLGRPGQDTATALRSARDSFDQLTEVHGAGAIYVEALPRGMFVVRSGQPPSETLHGTIYDAVTVLKKAIGSPPPAANLVFGPKMPIERVQALSQSVVAGQPTEVAMSAPHVLAMGAGKPPLPPVGRSATVSGADGPRRPTIQVEGGDAKGWRGLAIRLGVLKRQGTGGIAQRDVAEIPAAIQTRIPAVESPMSYHVVSVFAVRPPSFLSRLSLRLDVVVTRRSQDAQAPDVPRTYRETLDAATEQTKADAFVDAFRSRLLEGGQDISVYAMLTEGDGFLLLSRIDLPRGLLPREG